MSDAMDCIGGRSHDFEEDGLCHDCGMDKQGYEIRRLRTKLAEAREVIRFYENEKHWAGIGTILRTEIEIDRGKKARQWLADNPEGEDAVS